MFEDAILQADSNQLRLALNLNLQINFFFTILKKINFSQYGDKQD